MCGLAGFIVPTSTRGTSHALHAMADAILHRGPDDEGFFEAIIANGDHHLGLAHRRLSIIDLSGGHQPMTNEDGSVQIVFNGEIYNYSALRDELIAAGHHFKTHSDTETIVHAYEQWGVACVEKFRGMFAFALWDFKQEKLFLARDRFGKKPLFLYQQDGLLLFASEIKAILTFPGVRAPADMSSIWDYFAYRYVPNPWTLFSGISKLMPGCYAIWQRGTLTQHRYYSPPDQSPYQQQTDLPKDPVAGFLAKLDESVAIRMISDVPFGAFLSGGIDSSAVVGLMSQHSSQPIKTFSVGFKETQYSELSYAREIADFFKTDHHELTVSQDHLIAHLPDLVRFRDAPVSEPSDIPIYLLAKEASHSVKMILTGEGADEFLGGYPKHSFERFAAPCHYLPKLFRNSLTQIVNALPYKYHRAKTAVNCLAETNYETRMPRWFGALSPEERNALLTIRPPIRTINNLYTDFSIDNSALRRILYFDQTSWLPDNLLERGDRMTMAASIEARMPFMDHELAAYVSYLPDNFRVRGQQRKWILREAMKLMLPKNILQRPKVGFKVPVNEWFRGTMRDYLYDHLDSPQSKTNHFYERSALRRILHEHETGVHNHEKLLWCMLNLEILFRIYGEVL